MQGIPLKTAYSGDPRVHVPREVAALLSKWARETAAQVNAEDEEGVNETTPSDHPSETTEDEDS